MGNKTNFSPPIFAVFMKVKVLIAPSCLTLYNPMNYSPPGFSVHGILQARILLEWVVYSPPGDLPDPEIEPRSPALQADSSQSEPCSVYDNHWI